MMMMMIEIQKEHGLQAVSLQCESCRFVATLLHNVWGDSILDNCIAELVIYICEDLHIEDNFVCTGMIGQFKVFFVFLSM